MTAIELIERFEGCRLHRYLCPAGYWTIGYGHVCSRSQPDITQTVADALLAQDMIVAEHAVLRLTRPRNPTPGQYAALVSFTFNLGAGNLAASTLIHRYREGDDWAAANEFLKWVHGGGRVLPGLVARRAAERAAFLSQK